MLRIECAKKGRFSHLSVAHKNIIMIIMPFVGVKFFTKKVFTTSSITPYFNAAQ
jgi:hypothetical protein